MHANGSFQCMLSGMPNVQSDYCNNFDNIFCMWIISVNPKPSSNRTGHDCVTVFLQLKRGQVQRLPRLYEGYSASRLALEEFFTRKSKKLQGERFRFRDFLARVIERSQRVDGSVHLLGRKHRQDHQIEMC